MIMVAPAAKRQYLRAADRRRAILVAADGIVVDGGLAGLSVAAVATKSGVSRQLIYRYFVDVNDLVLSWVRYRLVALNESFSEASQDHLEDSVGLTRRQLRVGLSLPEADRRLVRSIFGDLSDLSPELAESVLAVRARLLDRWTEIVSPGDAGNRLIRARIWALLYSMLGLWDFLDVGIINTEEALAILIDNARLITRASGYVVEDDY